MARTVRDANLETRTSRARLKARKKPYWRTLNQGQHLGYYKGARGGSWIARLFLGERQYLESTLAKADDTSDADGLEILSFPQAQEAARTWFTAEARRRAGLEDERGPYTVADAMQDYLDELAHRAKAIAPTKHVIDMHILPAFGDRETAKLTTASIRDWHRKVAATPAQVRGGRNGSVRYRQSGNKVEATRRRRATANRILTVLKAALNHAWREGKVSSDAAWRPVKPFRSVDSAIVRYLTQAECVRLVNACELDFRQLVRAALLTGCRYGELTRLQVSDFDPDAGTVAVRTSKSGKPRHVILTDEAGDFFAESTAGQPKDTLIFRRADGGQWGTSHQRRPLLEACSQAGIKPAVSFHILRHTHGSQLAMQGVPLAVIAQQLGHADTRMTERHYAHLSPSYVADTIRASFPRLGILEPAKVAALPSR